MDTEQKYYKDLLQKDPETQKRIMMIPLSRIGEKSAVSPEANFPWLLSE